MENYADQTVAAIEAKLAKLEEFQPLGKQYNNPVFFTFKKFTTIGNSYIGVEADYSMYEIAHEYYFNFPTDKLVALAWNRNKQIWEPANGVFKSDASEEEKRKVAEARNEWSLFVSDEAGKAGAKSFGPMLDQVNAVKAHLKAELKAAKAKQAEVAKLIKASEKGAAKAKAANPYRNAL